MKQTPRNAENRAVKMLNEYLFTPLGLPSVERVPVIGRRGPDISINEFKLVVDVKSRLRLPLSMWVYVNEGPVCRIIDGRLMAIPLCKIEWLLEPYRMLQTLGSSKVITDYYDHMDEWRKEKCPDGITALILRRPGMYANKTLFVIGVSDTEIFRERYICLK
jgi:hypothetical protein